MTFFLNDCFLSFEVSQKFWLTNLCREQTFTSCIPEGLPVKNHISAHEKAFIDDRECADEAPQSLM